MAQLRPKIVKLAKIIGGVTGITTRIDENAPEYYCMAGILTDEEADVAIAAGLRKERTAGYLAKKPFRHHHGRPGSQHQYAGSEHQRQPHCRSLRRR